MEKHFDEIKCPLCEDTELELIHKEVDLDINYSYKTFLTLKNSYYICKKCQLIFIHPRPSNEKLKDYYSDIYVSQSVDGVEGKNKSLQYDNTINFLLENTEKVKIVVDIGMSSGYLLNEFKKFKNVELIGVEPSKVLCIQAEENYGIKSIQGQLEEINLENEGLLEIADLVICSLVIEHVINPKEFLEKLGKIVKPKGFLYIEVPSTQILGNLKDAAIYGRQIIHVHLNHFMASTLNYACSQLDFYPVKVIDDLNNNYPVLRALYVKQSSNSRVRDVFQGQIDIRETFFDKSIDSLIKSLNSDCGAIVLWGAGHDLFQLIRRYPKFVKYEKLILVDRSPLKITKDFFGLKIHDPSTLNFDNVSEIFITPSESILKIDIQKDIEENCPNHIKISFLFN